MKRERDDDDDDTPDAALFRAVHNLEEDANLDMPINRCGSTFSMLLSQRSHNNKNLDLLRLMLAKGSNVNAANERGHTALFYAAKAGTAEAVRVLIDAGALVNHVDCLGAMPLHYAACREDESISLGVAKALLESRAALETPAAPADPLFSACWRGTPAVVALLLACGANPNGDKRCTPMCCALRNRSHHRIIMMALHLCGAVATGGCPQHGAYARIALAHGASELRALANLVPANQELRGRAPQDAHPDPVGAWRAAVAHFGIQRPNTSRVIAEMQKGRSGHICWAMLRLMPPPQGETLAQLLSLRGPVGQLVAREAHGFLRHSVTWDTLFHQAASSGDLATLRTLMERRANPLYRNSADQTPLQVAANAEVRRLIAEYAVFRPDFWHADWYGPYFVMRARAFLLVAQRWRATGVRTLGRDVLLTIVQWVARVEEV